jgi:hypothetical protein
MILVPRSTIWPGQTPTSSTGAPRPLLAPDRPYLTIHYTGGGLWLDPDDSPTELKAIQAYATAAGKPWEYNYVVDGQGIVFEYAGTYRAAHYHQGNELAIGVLLLVGLAHVSPPSGFEEPTEPMIAAVRDLRAWLLSTGALAPDHAMLQHRQMPGAATICPGQAVIDRWTAFTAPVPPPPDPPAPPDQEDTAVQRRVKHVHYANIWLVGDAPALALAPELNAEYVDAGIPLVVFDHPQMLKSVLAQSGLDADDLVPS